MTSCESTCSVRQTGDRHWRYHDWKFGLLKATLIGLLPPNNGDIGYGNADETFKSQCADRMPYRPTDLALCHHSGEDSRYYLGAIISDVETVCGYYTFTEHNYCHFSAQWRWPSCQFYAQVISKIAALTLSQSLWSACLLAVSSCRLSCRPRFGRNLWWASCWLDVYDEVMEILWTSTVSNRGGAIDRTQSAWQNLHGATIPKWSRTASKNLCGLLKLQVNFWKQIDAAVGERTTTNGRANKSKRLVWKTFEGGIRSFK